jgi:hypothetical protein
VTHSQWRWIIGSGIVLALTLAVVLGLQAPGPSAPPPATPAVAIPLLGIPAFIAFERDAMRGQMPQGWRELEAGTYVSPDEDSTFVVQRLPPVPLVLILPVVLSNIGVDAQPEAHSQRRANDIDWALYRTTADAKPVDFALGQGASANYLILLQSPPGQEAAWYSAVFLPLVDALQATP